MAASGFDAAAHRISLPDALLNARAKFGPRRMALEDPERKPITHDQLLIGSLVLGRKVTAGLASGSRVGVLLPNVNGVVVTLFGLMFSGMTPVLLNFTAGVRNLVSACATAEVRVIVTSRRFVDTARLEEVVGAIGIGRRVIYLEDVRKDIGFVDKAVGLFRTIFARQVAKRACPDPDRPAVILFTSGSEGLPKGVALSHANIVSNVGQIWAHANGMLTAEDIAFNPLPVFHSFGLTAGLLVPLLNGMRTVLYPSPLHYKQVPKLIGETKATLLFATDTFLAGYARAAEEGELSSVRIVVTGAEKVKDSTRKLWAETGAQIMEGYGCTECSPVIACNLPTDNRPGTVGRMLPGMEARLDPVEGLPEGGRLVVRGPNVMAGYMLADAPGKLRPPEGGWHDTGDIVDISADGFVTIRGRAKRFAKLGGEMVSLAAVEGMASSLWEGATHVAVTLPDPRKGEQIVLVTDRAEADRAALLAFAQGQGMPELFVPRAVLVVSAIPVLGSGKVDYAGVAELARRMRPLI